MWFWWFMFICDLLIPIVMLVFGITMYKHCPKQINHWVGYRTTLSTKNMDTWKFAHDYCGSLWWKIGLIMVVPSVIIHIPFYHSDAGVIGIVGIVLLTIQFIVLLISVFLTEFALKKTFNDDGTRR